MPQAIHATTRAVFPHFLRGLSFQVPATRAAVASPQMIAPVGMTSTSADVAAHPIEEKASAKVASRDEVWRRRNWLPFARTRHQNWIAVAELAPAAMPIVGTRA